MKICEAFGSWGEWLTRCGEVYFNLNFHLSQYLQDGPDWWVAE